MFNSSRRLHDIPEAQSTHRNVQERERHEHGQVSSDISCEIGRYMTYVRSEGVIYGHVQRLGHFLLEIHTLWHTLVQVRPRACGTQGQARHSCQVWAAGVQPGRRLSIS
jgi:hypothetical protein